MSADSGLKDPPPMFMETMWWKSTISSIPMLGGVQGVQGKLANEKTLRTGSRVWVARDGRRLAGVLLRIDELGAVIRLSGQPSIVVFPPSAQQVTWGPAEGNEAI